MKLSAAVLLLILTAASPEIRYFHSIRPLTQIPAQGGQSCLTLDPKIFADAAPGLADLRLYRDNAEQPYAVRTAAAEEAPQKNIALLNRGERNGRPAFDAEMPDGKYSDLELAITGHDFIATVAVSGSSTQDGSFTKLGNYTIFDLTRQKLGRSTVLHLPESNFAYLHFDVTGPLRPEDFTDLSVDRLPATIPQFVAVAETSTATQKGRNSVFEFTVPAHVPVDRIVFSPAAVPAQFSRNVTINVAQITPGIEPGSRQGSEPPPATSYGNLLRVHTMQNGHRINEERLVIDAPRTDFATATKWTVTIENGDDAPLKLELVRLEMLQRTLCFEAAAGAHYALYYGDPALSSPRYDYATLFAPQSNAAQIIVGAAQPNPAYQPRPDDRPFTEKHPWLLWAALIGVIVLLGMIALRTAKRTAQTPT